MVNMNVYERRIWLNTLYVDLANYRRSLTLMANRAKRLREHIEKGLHDEGFSEYFEQLKKVDYRLQKAVEDIEYSPDFDFDSASDLIREAYEKEKSNNEVRSVDSS